MEDCASILACIELILVRLDLLEQLVDPEEIVGFVEVFEKVVKPLVLVIHRYDSFLLWTCSLLILKVFQKD